MDEQTTLDSSSSSLLLTLQTHLFGQQPRKGIKSCRMGRFSVHPSLLTSSLAWGRASQAWSAVCQDWGPASQAWGPASQPASQALAFRPGWLGLRPGCMAQQGKWTDGRTNGWTENLPILQDCPISRPLPCFPPWKPRKPHLEINLEQGKGPADHLMP